MESVLERLHCFLRVIREQCLLRRPCYAPTLNSGEARRAALVARFAADCALAIRRRRLPNKPPLSVSQRLCRRLPPHRRHRRLRARPCRYALQVRPRPHRHPHRTHLMRSHRFSACEAMGWFRIMCPHDVSSASSSTICAVEDSASAAPALAGLLRTPHTPRTLCPRLPTVASQCG